MSLWRRINGRTQPCLVFGGTTSPVVEVAAYNNEKDISAVAGDHDADLIKLALGQCHQDFKTTGGNPQVTLDKGNSLHRTVIREECPQIVARDVHGHPM